MSVSVTGVPVMADTNDPDALASAVSKDPVATESVAKEDGKSADGVSGDGAGASSPSTHAAVAAAVVAAMSVGNGAEHTSDAYLVVSGNNSGLARSPSRNRSNTVGQRTSAVAPASGASDYKTIGGAAIGGKGVGVTRVVAASAPVVISNDVQRPISIPSVTNPPLTSNPPIVLNNATNSNTTGNNSSDSSGSTSTTTPAPTPNTNPTTSTNSPAPKGIAMGYFDTININRTNSNRGRSESIQKLPKPEPQTILDENTFAFFRLHDTNPRRERNILYALHLWQRGRVAGDESKKGKGAFGRLNALLRGRKGKNKGEASAGAVHRLALAIRDRRAAVAEREVGRLGPLEGEVGRAAGVRLLQMAVAGRLESVAVAMVERGIGVRGGIGPHPAVLAAALGLESVVRAFFKCGMGSAEWGGVSVLTGGILSGNLGVVSAVIEGDANAISVGMGIGGAELLRALKKARKPITISTQSLLQSSGQPNAFGQPSGQPHPHLSQKTQRIVDSSLIIYPFELAAACGHVTTLRYILPRTDPRIITSSRLSLLFPIDLDSYLYIIKAGANPSMQTDAYGASPLHLAARSGNLDHVVALLLSNKISVNITSRCNWTPLHEAVANCRKDTVQYLLRKGADKGIRSVTGDTPVDIATKIGFSSDEISLYFDRPVDDAMVKRKEDTISSMLKLIVVNDVVKSGSIFMGTPSTTSSSNASLLVPASRDSRKASKGSITNTFQGSDSSGGGGGNGSSKRKTNDKFPGLPSFLSRSSSSSNKDQKEGMAFGQVGMSSTGSVQDSSISASSSSNSIQSYTEGMGSQTGGSLDTDTGANGSPKTNTTKPSKRKLFGKSKS